jgi:gluconolactonase
MTAAIRDAVSEVTVLAGTIDHPEAVAWWDGAVWCGTEAGDLIRIDPATGETRVVARTGGFLLGLAFDGDGYCYACDMGLGRVVRIGLNGAVEVLADSVAGRRLSSPNYLVFRSDGTLYVTESGSGWEADDGYLFRIRPGHEPEVVSQECRAFPNGLALSADQRTLYVVESRQPGVVTYELDGDAVGPRREFLHLPRTVPDGLALDSSGALYVSCWRPDRVYRVAAGSDAAEIYLDDWTAEYLNSPTNLCFGGPDLSTIYLAGLGGYAISQISAEVPGQPLAFPSVKEV